MIAFSLVLLAAANAPERCDAVRRDHEEFKAWAFSELRRFEASKKGQASASERANWTAFENKSEARISELNRRYANCRED